MTSSRLLAILAAALLTTAAAANAGDKEKSSQHTAQQKFEQLDTDQDRAISQTEAANDDMLSETFASVDADGDGEITRSEYTAQLSDEDSEPSGSDY
jgi:ABC-type transporter MlaC component